MNIYDNIGCNPTVKDVELEVPSPTTTIGCKPYPMTTNLAKYFPCSRTVKKYHHNHHIILIITVLQTR
jgi:hypothetical protein